jgi:uncharacterized protein
MSLANGREVVPRHEAFGDVPALFMKQSPTSPPLVQAALRRLSVPRSPKKVSVQTLIDRIVKRIVKRFRPEIIILFGSHARGEAGPDSDVDLLIVMPVQGSVREKRLEIRQALHDMPVPLDVIVSRPQDFAWRKDVVGTIEWPATKEGKVLYAHSEGHHHADSGVARQGGK